MQDIVQAQRAPRPSVRVGVVLDRVKQPNRWQDWGFTVAEVVHDQAAFGSEPRVLRDDGVHRRTLFPGFTVELHVDQADGYYLNLSSGTPVWFVVWRIDDEDPSRAWPETVSVSYTEAGRWLDAQERVDNVPLQAELVPWLQAYADEHYRPEEKRARRRPQSFVAPAERK